VKGYNVESAVKWDSLFMLLMLMNENQI